MTSHNGRPSISSSDAGPKFLADVYVDGRPRSDVELFAGLDLGNTTGFAVLDEFGKRIYSTHWKLGKQRPESMAMFASNLRYGLIEHGVTVLGYEVVRQAHRSKLAAVSYGRYEGLVWCICIEFGLSLVGFEPLTIKRHAAGFVQADKEDMEAIALKKWNVLVGSHDESDALFIADLTRIKSLHGGA